MWRHILKLTSSPSERDCVHITLNTKSDDNSAVSELRLEWILSFFPSQEDLEDQWANFLPAALARSFYSFE